MNNNSKKIKSVVKAFSIIDVLVENNNSMSLSNISNKLDMPLSTIHGLINTLVGLGFVYLNQENGQYELSSKFFELGYATSNNWIEIDKVEKIVVDLSIDIEKSVIISKLVDNHSLCIFKRDSSDDAVTKIPIGQKAMANTVSSGKCMLAFLDVNEARYLLSKEQLTKSTENTIIEIDLLMSELALIRKNGYALDNEEYVKGTCAISRPIFDDNNKVVAAITILLSNNNFNKEYLDFLNRELYETSIKISKYLAFE